MGSAVQHALLRTVTRVSTALRSERIQFALTGGCAELERVLREAVPDMVVHNDVRIVRAGEPTDREELK